MLALDLDGFKQINDDLGHDQGDVLLRRVADRLKLAVRRQDTIFRIGGDEFCIVIDEFDQESSAEIVADRILGDLARPFRLQNVVVETSVSIGIADYPKDTKDTIDAETLFRFADEALYRAKNAGRGAWRR